MGLGMSAVERNRRRVRAVAIANAWKALLPAGKRVVISFLIWPVLLTAFAVLAIAGRRVMTREAYRTVFLSNGALKAWAQHVLADLRGFTFADTSAFDPDPLVMARRQGRRDVWLRISNYLLLDEEQVHKLMEVDDGF